MRTFIFSLIAVAALAFVVGNPGQARASWLSEALHNALDRNQPAPYYYPAPAYPYPGDYTPVDPYAPTYGYPYPPSYYVPDHQVPDWPRNYHREWRNDPRWRHHEERDRDRHEHQRR